jgi:hypothetical protein
VSGVRLLDHWSAPDGAGAAVACLATTFTFDADFFAQECVSRFLGLSTVTGEGDRISSIAAVLEEEDRLSEAQVSVLVDRSSPAEKRNLRWELLPVAAPGGLLHAKVALLLWERHCRIVVGSANLTSAGYRRQVELALAIDLAAGCQVPRPVLDELGAELGRLVDLAPGPRTTGPKARALATLRLLAQHVGGLTLPDRTTGPVRIAVAPARPGVSPFARLSDVWHGPLPLEATVLSPFWDDALPAPGVTAVRERLTGRPVQRRRLTLVAAIDPHTGGVHAPPSLAAQPGARLVAFKPPDEEPRTLHAKLVLVESDEWIAALVGSSNATEAGLGLHRTHGHRELNVWIGCPANSQDAKALRALAGIGQPIPANDQSWDAAPDEDEVTGPLLPLGFVNCLVDPAAPARAQLTLDPARLPSTWEVRDPAGQLLLDTGRWRAEGATTDTLVTLPSGPLPAYLMVHWVDGCDPCHATWTANVDDRAALPPPAELAELPVDVLLAALASTRPLPFALEQELRRRERRSSAADHRDLDPLRRFDNSGLLLQRVRHLSLAFWRLQERLSRPASNLDALHWRLHGAFGPLMLADGLITAASKDQALPGEPQFLLAELALTVAAVDWSAVSVRLDRTQVNVLVSEVLRQLRERHSTLPPAPDPALDKYVRDALEVAAR